MKINTKQISVMQVLPHLNSGGLVSGAVEVAQELVNSNFKSLIVSEKPKYSAAHKAEYSPNE